MSADSHVFKEGPTAVSQRQPSPPRPPFPSPPPKAHFVIVMQTRAAAPEYIITKCKTAPDEMMRKGPVDTVAAKTTPTTR